MACHLLIVEDDPHLRQMLTWDLEDLGYRVRAAADCRDALALAAGQDFDLALLDYHLPDGDGIDLLERLRALQPRMRVLLCSGAPPSDTVTLAIRKGAYAFVTKPVRAEGLHRSFQAALADGAGRAR
jgi:DNA-binding NtrC family response regulator